MTVYHVETQEAYDALMIELEENGCKWLGGAKPTKLDKFKNYGKDTYIFDESGVLSFSNGYYFIAYCSDETLIEYKSKGENMTEEMKQKIFDWARDVSVATESFARRISEEKADLQEAKSSAKKLIENIDEYLETLKPEFKVGDYVVDDSSYITMKVDETSNSVVDSAICYNFRYFTFRDNFVCEAGYLRHATPEEIAEYEVALTFHKHGRKPFKLKNGDLIRKPSGNFTFISNPENYTKEDFLKYGWEFLKTSEEVNEWL